METFGQALRRWREIAGLSKAAVASFGDMNVRADEVQDEFGV